MRTIGVSRFIVWAMHHNHMCSIFDGIFDGAALWNVKQRNNNSWLIYFHCRWAINITNTRSVIIQQWVIGSIKISFLKHWKLINWQKVNRKKFHTLGWVWGLVSHSCRLEGYGCTSSSCFTFQFQQRGCSRIKTECAIRVYVNGTHLSANYMS